MTGCTWSRLLTWPGPQGEDADPDDDDDSSDDGPGGLAAHDASLDDTRPEHEPGETDHHKDEADGPPQWMHLSHRPSLSCREAPTSHLAPRHILIRCPTLLGHEGGS